MKKFFYIQYRKKWNHSLLSLPKITTKLNEEEWNEWNIGTGRGLRNITFGIQFHSQVVGWKYTKESKSWNFRIKKNNSKHLKKIGNKMFRVNSSSKKYTKEN